MDSELDARLLLSLQKEFKLQQINEMKKKKADASKKPPNAERKKKVEPLFEIEGNQKLNKLNKLQFKKQKKEKVRRGMFATQCFFGIGEVLNEKLSALTASQH